MSSANPAGPMDSPPASSRRGRLLGEEIPYDLAIDIPADGGFDDHEEDRPRTGKVLLTNGLVRWLGGLTRRDLREKETVPGWRLSGRQTTRSDRVGL